MRLSFAAVRDDGGEVTGILCTATENTEWVVTKRQTDCLRRLATRCAPADSPEAACRIAAAVLDERERDVPFAVLYLLNRERGALEMVASAGLNSVPEGLSRVVPLDTASEPWRIAAAAVRSQPSLVEEVAQLLRPVLRRPDPLPQRAIAIPLLSGGPESPFGLLLAGFNPMRPTEESRQFHQDAAAHLESAIRSARMKQLAEERARGLAALDRAKTVFFANISHELRTPLTLLMGPLGQVLEDPGLEPIHRELLETAQQAVGRLHKLINSLLEFSRVEAGRANPHYQPTDLARLTADLAGMFRSAFESANVALIVDCPPTPQPAYVDPEMWAKIVHNLLSNALKFTLEGQVTVRLLTSDGHFHLEVIDTGCGIAKEDLARIFQRFAMVRAPRARTVEGTGLGLSLARELAALHGGSIAVSSEPGAGTRFTVRIPRGFAHLPADRVSAGRAPPHLQANAQTFLNEALGWLDGSADSAALTVNPAPAAAGTGSAGTLETVVQAGAVRHARLRERVLVVDDNAPMRQYLSRLLKNRWHVETEADGAAALDHVRAHPPDVVVADVMMPRMDGIELLRALRSEPALADIPVLVLSARAGEEASVEGLEAGANDYLVKPFSQRELVARIEAMLAQGRQRAAERLARTQAEENLRAREEFFAALAHELRSPVSSLFSWLEVLQSGRVTRSQVLGSLEVFELAATTLRRLSQDLYDVARARSRPLVAPRPFVSIAPLVATVVEAFEPAAARKRITLYRMLGPESGPASVDPERLQQIVTNLLSNAIRFTPPGGRIDITCARRAEKIELRVSDTGRGIPAEALPHVFERYWQGRRPADDDSGLGLGLSISRRLVELHGGDIEAVSEGEGLGATFVIQFPLAADRPGGHVVLQEVPAPARVRDSALATQILAERQVARGDSAAA